MGLLDAMDDPQTRMLMGLLAAAGPSRVPMSFGQRAFGAMQQFQAEQAAQEERKQRQAMQQMQMQQMAEQQAELRRQREQQAKDQSLLQQAFSPMPGPTQDGGALMPRFDPGSMVARGMSLPGVQGALSLHQAMQKPEVPLMKLAPGEQAFDPRNPAKPVFGVPAKDESPADIKEYLFAVQQGYKGSYNDFRLEGKKAGATNVVQKVENKTGESLASQVGPIAKDTREQAIAGVGLVDSAQRINKALEGGKVYAGPLANQRLKLAQVGDLLGIAGSDTAEKINNTRNVIRGMAEQAVKARSQLGGQAQISNSEQELLNKATSGDIADLTIPELRMIAGLNDRLGRQLYERHQQTQKVMRSRPGLGTIADFFDVPPLPGGGASAPSGVRRYNPATGRIE